MKNGIFLSVTLISIINGAELQYGHGTIDIKSGFFGLDATVSDDINTYSLVENHSNLFGTNFFYGYTFTIFDSKTIKQGQKDINSGIDHVNSFFKSANGYMTIPALEYTMQGFDGGVTLGYDLIHQSENDYFGIGLYGGASAPYIKSKKSLSKTVKVNMKMADYFKESKTELLTYKLGVGVYGQKRVSDFLAIYGNAIYAYQTGTIKNKFAKTDLDIDGSYLEFNSGLKLKAFNNSALSGLYGTIGWRYRNWNVDNASINISGIGGVKTPKSDMEFSSNALTVGVGYSF